MTQKQVAERLQASAELEDMFKKLRTIHVPQYGEHAWVDTCDLFRMFQKYNRALKDLL